MILLAVVAVAFFVVVAAVFVVVAELAVVDVAVELAAVVVAVVELSVVVEVASKNKFDSINEKAYLRTDMTKFSFYWEMCNFDTI